MRHRASHATRRAGIGRDPEWYKDAIIYELRIRSFFDSNDDGIGDLRGLTSKLDYLADLGVTALWLLPFYPSPRRDDGYDISDYTSVDPDLGTLEDFKQLLDQAHARGLRVITELVLNHTSDQHPWFQRARRAPRGSAERDFYVWSGDGAAYRDARIIFKDFETSNWSRDLVANDYFWHRFYSHQPDLNFENPAVHDALFEVVDFWLEMGVDGLRLDAVPYLYEEDGTSCENLPKTHAFLRTLRAHVDAKFEGRMLLAEANQWPEDAAAYFGTGDECHMNFHFPIMPRMFMAIHMEDSFPIVDILAQTPAPPAMCQWALFLRNHDELTLEMVTDDERDYMYRAYASDPAARINLGIRRRLAPLVGNDRRKLELLDGLLLSLSGTPVLYYGDEIGMGDNVFLGDRNGVRTPMQWSMDRNAGFSRASSQRLILPVNVDSEYHYEYVNVEVQQNNPSSLLWWTKRLISVRRDFQAFGRGTFELLTSSNHRVLSFMRRYGDETILVVANLSRVVQYVEIQLPGQSGRRPVELFGGSVFPAMDDGPFRLTLGGHQFYWFSLEPTQATDEVRLSGDVTVLVAASVDSLLAEQRAAVEDRLPAFLAGRPWFRGRDRDITHARVAHVIPYRSQAETFHWLVTRVEYAEAEPELYALLLSFIPEAMVRESRGVKSPEFLRVRLETPGAEPGAVAGVLVDALEDPAAARAVVDAIAEGPSSVVAPPSGRRSERGRAGLRAARMGEIDVENLASPPSIIAGTHANVAVKLDDRYLLKLFRHIDEGTSIDLDLTRALNAREFAGVPRVLGTLSIGRSPAEPLVLAMLEDYVANAGTAWHQARAELGRYYERVLTTSQEGTRPPAPLEWQASAAPEDVPPLVRDLMGSFVDTLLVLGRRTGELHRELLAMPGDDFAPETYSSLTRRSEYQTLRNLAGTVFRELEAARVRLTGQARADADTVLTQRDKTIRRLEPLLTAAGTAIRIRIHGNYHLEQVLFTGKDFIIFDFGGELDRSLNERRRKQSPLRDVAGMLASLDTAALVALWEPGLIREADRAMLAPWGELWSAWAGRALLTGYAAATAGTPLLPTDAARARTMLDAFALERTLRDLREELRVGTDHSLIHLRVLARATESRGS